MFRLLLQGTCLSLKIAQVVFCLLSGQEIAQTKLLQVCNYVLLTKLSATGALLHRLNNSTYEEALQVDLETVPLLSDTQSSNDTTTITASSTSYVHHGHDTVVKPEQSTVIVVI